MNLRKILKESVWIYLFVFISAVAGYFVRVLYARNFTVAQYGLFYAVLSFVLLFKPLRELGFGASQVFYMNKYIYKKEYAKAKGVFILSLVPPLVLSIFVSIFLFAFKSYLAKNFFKDPMADFIIEILIIYSIIQVVILSLAQAFASIQKYFMFQVREPLNIIFVFLFSLIFFKINLKFVTPTLAYLFSAILVLLIYIFVYRKTLSILKVNAIYNKKIIKEVFAYAFTYSIGGFAWVVLSYLDTTLITGIKGVESVGYYNVVLPTMQIVFLLTNPMINILFSVSANFFHSKDKSKLDKVISFVYNNFLIFTLPLASALFVYSKEIINFIFGSKYVVASPALKIYLVFWIFVFLRQVNFVLLAAIGEIKYSSKMLWIELGFNTISAFILITFFDYTGAVVANGIGAVLMTILTYNFLRKRITIKIDYLQQLKTLFAGILFILSAVIFIHKLSIPIPKFGVVAEGLIVFSISGAFYCTLLIITGVITKEKIIFLKRLILNSDKNSK